MDVKQYHANNITQTRSRKQYHANNISSVRVRRVFVGGCMGLHGRERTLDVATGVWLESVHHVGEGDTIADEEHRHVVALQRAHGHHRWAIAPQ